MKADFEAKLRQAVQQQLGMLAGVKIDVERQPQFQEEWRQIQLRLDAQYNMHLDEARKELAEIK